MCSGEFKPIKNHGLSISNCPLCGSPGELWEYFGPFGFKKVVCCAAIVKFSAIELCLFELPPESFHENTKTEAVETWNTFCNEVTAFRDKQNNSLK